MAMLAMKKTAMPKLSSKSQISSGIERVVVGGNVIVDPILRDSLSTLLGESAPRKSTNTKPKIVKGSAIEATSDKEDQLILPRMGWSKASNAVRHDPLHAWLGAFDTKKLNNMVCWLDKHSAKDHKARSARSEHTRSRNGGPDHTHNGRLPPNWTPRSLPTGWFGQRVPTVQDLFATSRISRDKWEAEGGDDEFVFKQHKLGIYGPQLPRDLEKLAVKKPVVVDNVEEERIQSTHLKVCGPFVQPGQSEAEVQEIVDALDEDNLPSYGLLDHINNMQEVIDLRMWHVNKYLSEGTPERQLTSLERSKAAAAEIDAALQQQRDYDKWLESRANYLYRPQDPYDAYWSHFKARGELAPSRFGIDPVIPWPTPEMEENLGKYADQKIRTYRMAIGRYRAGKLTFGRLYNLYFQFFVKNTLPDNGSRTAIDHDKYLAVIPGETTQDIYTHSFDSMRKVVTERYASPTCRSDDAVEANGDVDVGTQRLISAQCARAEAEMRMTALVRREMGKFSENMILEFESYTDEFVNNAVKMLEEKLEQRERERKNPPPPGFKFSQSGSILIPGI